MNDLSYMYFAEHQNEIEIRLLIRDVRFRLFFHQATKANPSRDTYCEHPTNGFSQTKNANEMIIENRLPAID